jgi:hypothetical protein
MLARVGYFSSLAIGIIMLLGAATPPSVTPPTAPPKATPPQILKFIFVNQTPFTLVILRKDLDPSCGKWMTRPNMHLFSHHASQLPAVAPDINQKGQTQITQVIDVSKCNNQIDIHTKFIIPEAQQGQQPPYISLTCLPKSSCVMTPYNFPIMINGKKVNFIPGNIQNNIMTGTFTLGQ